MENVGGRSVLGGQRGGVPVTREKQAVHAGFGLKPDRLTGGEIRPSKPSQTFSPNPARTDLDEGAFADLTGRNGTRSPFSQVKSAIEHKRRYELSNCYLLLVSNGFGGDKIEDTLSEKRFLYGEVSELQFFKRA
ncbi:hypothetical protein [Aeromonas rivipollensis]|uniref:hypothetical protein n=1 Tax=Aeromonas rivipollensis TaxID=948519 RepID=UPI003D237279